MYFFPNTTRLHKLPRHLLEALTLHTRGLYLYRDKELKTPLLPDQQCDQQEQGVRSL